MGKQLLVRNCGGSAYSEEFRMGVSLCSGMAMAAAAALDHLEYPEVVGSIAGDDTIMAAVRTSEETVLLMEKIRRMLEES
jgi:transcriptional regulator of arginine metabolism